MPATTTLWPTAKPCATVVVIVTVEPDSVAPAGEAAIGLTRSATPIVPVLLQAPCRVIVPPEAWTVPLLVQPPFALPPPDAASPGAAAEGKVVGLGAEA